MEHRTDHLVVDIQMVTPHLARLGGTHIPRDAYLEILRVAVAKQCGFPAAP